MADKMLRREADDPEFPAHVTPSLAGTAETMTPADVVAVRQWMSENIDALADGEFGEWLESRLRADLYGRVLNTYAALAERTAERDAWCREAGRLERENALLRAGAPLPLPAPTTISASTARGCATKVLDAARPHATPEGE